ncbi:TPA: histidine kinase [Streptococcus equi subsp. zooepidemicus]|nr:histidine kinase [Streptococcus equi subsp. zooepidemicus]
MLGMSFFYALIFVNSWVIFSTFSGIKLAVRSLLLVGACFVVANLLLDHVLLVDQLVFVAVSVGFAPHKKASEHLFNGLFAIMIVELLFRIIGSFLLPAVLGYSIHQINNDIGLLMVCHALVLPAFYLFSYIFSVDLTLIKFISEDKLKKWVFWMNAALLFYYVMVHCMINIQGDFFKIYFRYRSVMIFLYLMLLIWVIVKLDRFAKDQLSQRLALAQKERVAYLEKHNQYIERLCREIRAIKHDSENILISLKDSIDSGDIAAISKVYQTVIQESASSIRQLTPELSALDNVQDSVIRSLLHAKLLEAKLQGIAVYIDIPEMLASSSVRLLDVIVLFKVVIDNAILSAKGSSRPFLSIAYFNQDGKRFFIIENSTRLKRVDIAKQFDASRLELGSHANKRLLQFSAVLERYPHITFSTKSDHYRLRQLLEMR